MGEVHVPALTDWSMPSYINNRNLNSAFTSSKRGNLKEVWLESLFWYFSGYMKIEDHRIIYLCLLKEIYPEVHSLESGENGAVYAFIHNLPVVIFTHFLWAILVLSLLVMPRSSEQRSSLHFICTSMNDRGESGHFLRNSSLQHPSRQPECLCLFKILNEEIKMHGFILQRTALLPTL